MAAAVTHQDDRAVRPTRRVDLEIDPLVVGTDLRCPRCLKLHNVLEYVPLKRPARYQHELNWVTKCPSCRFIFSPAARLLEVFLP